MSLYLAIDAGGTKTDYALADDTAVLARARTGSIKRLRVDALTATEHLRHGIAMLAAASRRDLSEIVFTCIGAAGESVPLVADFLRTAHREHIRGELLLLGDTEIALEAAFPDAGGVLVIAGTGSNVAGRCDGGPVSTTGGYGHLLADQGSGYRIGLEALRAALLALDEGRSSELLSTILSVWNLETLDELVAFGNAVPSPDFSNLVPAVVECAKTGDGVAREVLERGGVELGYLVRLMLRRLRRESGTPHWTAPLAFTGSVAAAVNVMREALLRSVRAEFPDVVEAPGIVDPLEGALLRARRRG